MLNQLKNIVFKTFNKLLHHEETQESLFKAVNKSNQKITIQANTNNPYLSIPEESAPVSLREDIVFITSRFRSGSTVLWNAFRKIDDCTAYYEPFNERRWFDKSKCGDYIDTTHIGVDNYWAEYDGLSHLDKFYNESWIRENLLMDQNSWDPNMQRFIEEIINHAKNKPVLQFNRVDFRLPWLRKCFPNAKILHLYRHPREQWFSFLTHKQLMNKNDVEKTYLDAFYLDSWCKDLAKYFPFLEPQQTPHPYQRFYYLWKLSYLYGLKYAHHSIRYEELCNKPNEELNKVFKILGWAKIDIEKATSVILSAKFNQWKQYADEDWFSKHEQICEDILNKFFAGKAE